MKKIITTLLITSLSAFSINIGEIPPIATIDKENGGRIDGTAFSSKMIKDKVYVMFYVDPDEKDTNNDFSEALKAKNYSHDKFGSIAVINLKATWLPNFVLENILKSKQEEYPDTIYVKDKIKYLVQGWNLADDSSDILLFNKKGELIYSYAGKMDSTEIEKALKLIDENL